MAAEEWERLKRRDTPSAPVLDSEAEHAARLFLDVLKKSYDVAELIAFGSRARGDNRADSDLDLAVILNGARKNFLDTKLDMANCAFDVLMETGILVQPLPLWKDDLRRPENFSNPDLIKNILAEGARVA
ncbi:MAG: nucleotidyltransferase domain-containing protein [Alphaproteobacteria bacterium]|nr:nucleotidyltransferase domain-containing protein [Alphaproteobacteria bacterium]